MHLYSIFYSSIVFFQAYSLLLIVPMIIGLMISVFLFRKKENYSFILLVLILSLLSIFYIPSFMLAGNIFFVLTQAAGALFSFIIFILLNLFFILIYLYYKKIFSSRILLKYLALPFMLIFTAAGFSIITGLIVGLIFFNSDNPGNIFGAFGGIFLTVQISVGFNILLAWSIYNLLYKRDIDR